MGGYIQVAAVGGYPGRRSGKYAGRRKVRYPGSHKERRLAWREGEGEISRSPQDGGLKIAGRRSTEVASGGRWRQTRSPQDGGFQPGRQRRQISRVAVDVRFQGRRRRLRGEYFGRHRE